MKQPSGVPETVVLAALSWWRKTLENPSHPAYCQRNGKPYTVRYIQANIERLEAELKIRHEMARHEVQRLEAKAQAVREAWFEAKLSPYADTGGVEYVAAQYDALAKRLDKARIELARWRP